MTYHATIAPTPERIAKAHGHIDAPIVDQKTSRAAWRVFGVMEGMRRRGWLSDEQQAAYIRFAADYEKADRIHSVIGGYGDRIGGTQQDDGTPWDPLDHKIDAHRKVMAALDAIAYPRVAAALISTVVEETTLDRIGRIHAGENVKNRAIAAAKQMLQIGTYMLAKHYGMIAARRDPP